MICSLLDSPVLGKRLAEAELGAQDRIDLCLLYQHGNPSANTNCQDIQTGLVYHLKHMDTASSYVPQTKVR